MSSIHAMLDRTLAVAVGLIGLLLLAGGVMLLGVGGSAWYASTGLLLLPTAVFLWRRSRWGLRLYAFMLTYTMAWAIWEVGWNAWALMPRLLLLMLLGLWMLVQALPLQRTGVRVSLLAACGVLAGVLSWVASSPAPPRPRLTAGAPLAGSDAPAGEWRHYGRDANGSHYSPLGQVGVANVGALAVAWVFRTGEHGQPGEEYNFEVTPLKVGRLLYACTPRGQVIALDAATGSEAWRFDAGGQYRGAHTFICRGVTYHDTGIVAAACAQRIYATTPDNRLWSLDALTGRPCAGFGQGGAVDLLAGLGEVPPGSYGVTSPPVVTRGRIVIGSRVADNVSVDMPSGVVRAYDALDGHLSWAWDVGRPDENGPPPAGGSYTRSTPNAWAPMVADDSLGIVYVPTGNPAPDYDGRRRRPFDEQYGSSLVALDAETGRARWRFQATHHDVWDNDLGSQPVLVDLPRPGGRRQAVVFGTKQGNIFVLDRISGEPIVPVSELSVPQASSIGEPLSATQPASALAVNPGPARLTEAAMWGLTPIDQMWCRIQFRRARYEGPYTPPGTDRPTVAYPGMFGGIEWGGITVDPVRRVLVVNPNAMPFIVRMASVPGAGKQVASPGAHAEGLPAGLAEMRGTGHAVSYYGLLSPLKMPCLQPPWGELEAVSLDDWQVLWRRPVGTTVDSGPLGVASHLPLLVGTPQVGGTLATAGGVILAAATLDDFLRAYDVATGRELWRGRLPAGGQATPMTYEVDGRQFIVVAAGGHSVLGTRGGDYIVAYALPR